MVMDAIVRTSVCVHSFDYLGKPSLFGGPILSRGLYVLLLLFTYGGCRLQLLMLRCYRKKGHLLCGLSHAFCSTIASFLIRCWVGAHAFFAARTKLYGHTQKRRKHCRSFSELLRTCTSVTTYIPLPLWLFLGLRVWSSLVCCQFLLVFVCVSIWLL